MPDTETIPDYTWTKPPFRLRSTCWTHEFAGDLPAFEVIDRNGHTVAEVNCCGPGHEEFLRRAVARENAEWMAKVTQK